MNIQKTPAMEQLERDIHIAETVRRIKERAVRIKACREMLNELQEIEILEEHVEINKTQMVLFSVRGLGEGVCINKADLDSGEMTRLDGYLALSDMVEAQQRENN